MKEKVIVVEVTVEGIRRCCRSGQPVLILKDKSGGRFVPLRLPAQDAEVLEGELTGGHTRESHFYALLVSVLSQLGGKISGVVLHLGPNGLLQSCLRLDGERGGAGQVTAHPIDALAVALRQGSSIFINTEAVEKISFPAPRSRHADRGEGTEVDDAGGDAHGDVDLPPAVRDFLSTLDLSGLSTHASN